MFHPIPSIDNAFYWYIILMDNIKINSTLFQFYFHVENKQHVKVIMALGFLAVGQFIVRKKKTPNLT